MTLRIPSSSFVTAVEATREQVQLIRVVLDGLREKSEFDAKKINGILQEAPRDKLKLNWVPS